jgi:hypothetical protein
MTFEEWFEQTFCKDYFPKGERTLYEAVARKAWEASRDNLRTWDL